MARERSVKQQNFFKYKNYINFLFKINESHVQSNNYIDNESYF